MPILAFCKGFTGDLEGCVVAALTFCQSKGSSVCQDVIWVVIAKHRGTKEAVNLGAMAQKKAPEMEP